MPRVLRLGSIIPSGVRLFGIFLDKCGNTYILVAMKKIRLIVAAILLLGWFGWGLHTILECNAVAHLDGSYPVYDEAIDAYALWVMGSFLVVPVFGLYFFCGT